MTKKLDILHHADISEFHSMTEIRGNGTGPQLTEAELAAGRAARHEQREIERLRSINEALKATVRELQHTIRVICREER